MRIYKFSYKVDINGKSVKCSLMTFMTYKKENHDRNKKLFQLKTMLKFNHPHKHKLS